MRVRALFPSTSSEISRRVAEDVWRLAYEQEPGLFDFRRSDGTFQLLVIDRMDDPVTPLLSQWTYQAMVHQLLAGTYTLNPVDP
jgi:hypothetical protein